ncbi:23S rRNA (adenine(2503)-C(2))-methyltransferase RlmN [Candidatus Profftella armatura (Diaphorina cf. continua)]|uniref:Dual-specificity RNA methyltransferase RlmN n=1 Tax=Candidatus Profftella armatura (Diaphorina cf. continua) TaxID=2661583 RepID=A0A7R7AAZ6_9PROT|nr:23S rRNA (adenine(2503)-C(2))-methyltransferase RlmN [Candidatus Profftella armatura (Diaphorina cf. continua)]BCG49505.1 23S rRNA (adenine(2503)-C(2))-methyltransferase RlmN [Candidatus Profftella armatura (Diaphorina cf. continua)]
MINLLDLSPLKFVNYCQELGEMPFRAQQLQKWIHKFGVSDFNKMTDISISLRKKLKNSGYIKAPHIISDQISFDGTRKWIFNVKKNIIETVFIPEKNRNTLCISTQVGCAINCIFCSTGKQGFIRNLTIGEIIGQLWVIEFKLRKEKNIKIDFIKNRQITNIVMMGMGEPLLNYKSTIGALKLILSDHAYGLSRRHVILSTTGIIPMIDKLSKECPVELAISLHASNDNLRNQLIPISKKYPLKELILACHRYITYSPRHMITFEYCMLHGINDEDIHALELISLMKKNKILMSCKINLIPFNYFPNSNLICSKSSRIKIFAKILMNSGLFVTIRKIRGNDINAACGQLSGKILNHI